MATGKDLRRLALALEGTSEAPHFDRTAFKVARTYVTLSSDGRSANFKFTPDEQEFKCLTGAGGVRTRTQQMGRAGLDHGDIVEAQRRRVEERAGNGVGARRPEDAPCQHTAPLMTQEDLKHIAARTQDIYERNAARFDAERSKRLIERTWLDRFCSLLPHGGRILDLGCGSGDPIARYLVAQGHDVTGVDFSEPMLEIARARLPQARWICADMRALALGETFDGIIGWHSFFHLTADEQRRALARMAKHLGPGGALMLTVGPDAGEVTGHVGDDIVYHASLSPSAYESLLAEEGIEIVAFAVEDADCGGATVLLAQRRAGDAGVSRRPWPGSGSS